MWKLEPESPAPPAWLRRTSGSSGRRDAGATAVLNLVARHSKVPLNRLLQPSRGKVGICDARHLAMYLTHVGLSRTLTDVGEIFGRDRTSVAHACARIEDMRDDPAFDDEVAGLEAIVDRIRHDEEDADAQG